LNFKDLPIPYKYAYQVSRGAFDKLLLDHTRECGAHVFEGVKAVSLSWKECDGKQRPVSCKWSSDNDVDSGEIEFDYLIDASGRRGVIETSYLNSRRNHSIFQNIAVWGYWKGVKEIPGREGTTVTSSYSDGWIWGIPLTFEKEISPNEPVYSVGTVMHKEHFFRLKNKEKKDLKTIYLDALKQSPLIQNILGHPTAVLASCVQSVTDYSYTADSFAGAGYFMIGDAACFLDPLLSTGVHLATMGSFVSAATICSMLKKEITDDEGALFFDESYHRIYRRLLEMVSQFYTMGNKESHFFKAQQLVLEKEDERSSKTTFTKLVSGFTDLNEATNKRLDFYGIVNASGHKELPLNESNSVAGLYVVTEPKFGLCRVDGACRRE
jgi:flavin-dependent dehydrogenase